MDENFVDYVRGNISEQQYISSKERHKFVVGARVESLEYSGGVVPGDTGTICKVPEYQSWVSVHWDRHINGHSCDKTCPDGYGRNLGYEDLKLIES